MTIPLLTIFVAWLLIFLPRLVVAAGQAKRPEGYDNTDPRDQQAKLEGKARRARAAHENAFEGFAPFAAAVIVAHLGGADATVSMGLAIAYCVARLIYPMIYIAGLGTLRTAVWMIGFAATGALFLAPYFAPAG